MKITEKHWSKYATAGMTAALVGSQAAESAITTVQVGSANDGDINVGDDKYFNVTGSLSLNLFNFSSAFGNAAAAFGGIDGASVAGNVAGSFSIYISNLSPGINISTLTFGNGLGTFAGAYGQTQSQFSTAGTAYFAFRFDAGSGSQLGWARLTMDGGPFHTFTLEEFAFAGVNESLSVGQVPEPGSLGLLALGASGVLLNRRRKNSAIS
ncbi:MAG: PEP-CTERM sorting domain-containing protein [Verrucomicrobiota bacterium]